MRAQLVRRVFSPNGNRNTIRGLAISAARHANNGVEVIWVRCVLACLPMPGQIAHPPVAEPFIAIPQSGLWYHSSLTA
jgi:hypothetical protein